MAVTREYDGWTMEFEHDDDLGHVLWTVEKLGKVSLDTTDGLVALKVFEAIVKNHGETVRCPECGLVKPGECLLHTGYDIIDAWNKPEWPQLMELAANIGPTHELLAKWKDVSLFEIRKDDYEGHWTKWLVRAYGEEFETGHRLIAGMVFKEFVKHHGSGKACAKCGMMSQPETCDSHSGWLLTDVWGGDVSEETLFELRGRQNAVKTAKFQREKDLNVKLRSFRDAALELNVSWQNAENEATDSLLDEEYPFGESFDGIAFQIHEWVERHAKEDA